MAQFNIPKKLGMDIKDWYIRILSFPEENLLLALKELLPREEKILKLRMEGKTLSEIGLLFNIGATRVRQIEEKSLKKLSHPSRMKILKGMV
jgi:RNA polymerase primary sigma factor